uniref:C-type lectin domain-containing protein n=1 Tax=Chrysemys picta bellii TaxID=8478 RepID=A0A8C3HUP4_CHRPI
PPLQFNTTPSPQLLQDPSRPFWQCKGALKWVPGPLRISPVLGGLSSWCGAGVRALTHPVPNPQNGGQIGVCVAGNEAQSAQSINDACLSAGGSGCKLCPLDWQLRGDKCYWVSRGGKTWSESRVDCSARGSQLLVIRDQEELGICNAVSPWVHRCRHSTSPRGITAAAAWLRLTGVSVNACSAQVANPLHCCDRLQECGSAGFEARTTEKKQTVCCLL